LIPELTFFGINENRITCVGPNLFSNLKYLGILYFYMNICFYYEPSIIDVPTRIKKIIELCEKDSCTATSRELVAFEEARNTTRVQRLVREADYCDRYSMY
jgi:hypothetical protein